MYHDDATVRVAVQVKDALFNVPAVWRTIKIVATPSSALAQAQAGTGNGTHANAVSGTCAASNSTRDAGTCLVSVELRPEWFAASAKCCDGSQLHHLTLMYGFEDSDEMTWSSLGHVSVHPTVDDPAGAYARHRERARRETIGQNIVARLPARPVYIGETYVFRMCTSASRQP